MARKLIRLAGKHQWKEPSGRLLEHGRHIYVFRHTRTNQILYSFYPGLDKSHLKQLPFLGKHSVPPTVEAHLWKPYFTVNFPVGQQGREAYRKLREWRKLHETRWDEDKRLQEFKRIAVPASSKADRASSPAEKAQVNDEEAVAEDEVVDEDGADKDPAEGPYRLPAPVGTRGVNHFKRQKKLMRGIMDQRANTVADIAAILAEQKAHAVELGSAKQALLGKQLAYMHAKDRRFESEKSQMADRVTMLKKLIAKTQAKVKEPGDLEKYRKTLQPYQRGLTKAIKSQQLYNTTKKILKQLQTGQIITENQKVELWAFQDLPAKAPSEPFTLKGVTIQWADLYDAEYAAEWPTEVVHDLMGAVNRLPPAPTAEPVAYPVSADEKRTADLEQWAKSLARHLEQVSADYRDSELVEPFEERVTGKVPFGVLTEEEKNRVLVEMEALGIQVVRPGAVEEDEPTGFGGRVTKTISGLKDRVTGIFPGARKAQAA